MKIINISGGAIKFIALIVAFFRLVQLGIKPKVVTGVSSGSIIAFLYVCGKLKEGMEMAAKSHSRRIIFSIFNDPVGPISGLSISAIIKLLSGKPYIGVMDNLEKNLRKIVDKNDFYSYARNTERPDCFILAVDEDTQEQVVFNLKDLDYEQALSMVIGSSSIAPNIKAREVTIKGRKYKLNDGGHRDHSAGAYCLANGIIDPKKVKECITIFSRPRPDVYNQASTKDTSNYILRLINFVISTFIRETSLNDEAMEKSIMGDRYSPIYLDYFTNSTYDITKEEIQKGREIADKAVRNYLESKKD